MIYGSAKKMEAWNSSLESAEPEQSLWFSVSFGVTPISVNLIVRWFYRSVAHVVALILAGQLLIDSK